MIQNLKMMTQNKMDTEDVIAAVESRPPNSMGMFIAVHVVSNCKTNICLFLNIDSADEVQGFVVLR